MIEFKYNPIYVDEALILDQPVIEDAPRLFELTEKNREYLSEFLPWPKFTNTVDDSRAFIEKTIENREQDISYGYAIKDEGEIAGHISLMHLAEGRPEIGYWIASEYAGKGLTTRAAKALTDFALKTLAVPEVIIRAEQNNIGSNKVAEKSGYSLTGLDEKDGKSLNVWSIKNKL